MTFIAQDEINRIRSNASIVDVISSYIPLTQKGKNYFGVCPFHEDHSPSMSVSEEKQIYKCFSCGATGNVFTFVENYLNLSFAESVELIASKVGISLSTPLQKKKESKFKEEYALMDFTLKLYQNNLNTEEGQKAIAYLKKRGLLEDTIKDFSIGLSLDKNMLYTILRKKEYSEKTMEDLGLINKGKEDVYDVFQNRIMFPIHNLEGQVVGFTARCYLKEETPKYLNRNMDAIRLYSVGIKNVIALMGTSLTKEQIEAIKKLRSKVILMLDNDNAGETATLAIGNTLEENKISFSIVRLSGEKDPDEYIIKLNYFKKNKNLNEANDLAEYIKAVIDGLKNTTDAILKEVTLQKLAKDYNISYAVLKEQLGEKEIERKEKQELKVVKEKKESQSSYDKVCSKILFYMMNAKEYVKLYQTKLGIFPTKDHRVIANEIIYYLENHKTINLADFISYAENTNVKNEIMAIISNEKDMNITEDGMMELLSIIKKKIKKEEIKKLKEEIKSEYDINKKMALLEKIAELKKGNEFE